MTEKTISIIIPNYNGAAYLAACLASLREDPVPGTDIIVVDNGSTDGSGDLVTVQFPEVRLIRLKENTGFCGAVNVGIRASSDRDYVILLNNDTVIRPGFVRALVREAERDERIFSCQARMLSMTDPERLDDAGDLYCALGWAFARGHGRKDGPAYRKACDIFFACGGAALYRMACLKTLGLFDEAHFAYLEDLDIGWRARLSGYINRYVPDAVVCHAGSASSGSAYNLFKVRHASQNSVYVIGKNMPPGQLLLNLPLLLTGFLIKALFFISKGFGREYLKGLGRGFTLSLQARREGRYVPFDFHHMRQYIQIQCELWLNILKRVFEML